MSGAGTGSAGHRRLEVVAIVAAAMVSLFVVARLAVAWPLAAPWIVATAAATGYLTADLVSGIVHWCFDTWGSEDTPILGRNFIAPFREHHRDALAITRHDFIKTNGNNCLAALPMLTAACFMPTASTRGLFATAFLLFASLGLLATNQIHQWAHAEHPPAVVRLLQRLHLILPFEHHQRHHAPPHDTHYCITTGWLNPLFGSLELHRRLERGITVVRRRTLGTRVTAHAPKT
jgi:hypothetical protein